MGNLVSVNTATEVKKIINESVNSVAQSSEAQCLQDVQQSFALVVDGSDSLLQACGGVNATQQLNASFSCIQNSHKDSAFRNKLATDIVTRLKAARDGPSDIFSGISVNTAVSDQTVIDAVSQTLEQISKQNCQQNVSQGARVLVGNGGKLIIGQQSEAFLAAAATGCFERNNERACKALETGCGSLNITQELGVTGDCEQIDKITQTLENVLDVKVESDVSATSGANLALIFGIIGGILLLGLIIGLIAWAVSKSQKDKKKKEAEQQAQQQLVQRRQQAFQTRAAAPRQEFRSQTLATPPARPPTRFSDLSAVSGSAGTLSSTAKPARLAGTAFESQPSAASETYFQ